MTVQLFIFYGSFLVFPFIILLFYKGKNWKLFGILHKIIFVIFVFLTIFFIDNRFIEPNIITKEITQINIGLEKKVIPTYGDFDEGLTFEKNTQLFITSGLGLTGLPFRFLNPPVIDILEIK